MDLHSFRKSFKMILKFEILKKKMYHKTLKLKFTITRVKKQVKIWKV